MVFGRARLRHRRSFGATRAFLSLLSSLFHLKAFLSITNISTSSPVRLRLLPKSYLFLLANASFMKLFSTKK